MRTPVSEISVHLTNMLRINIRTPLKVIFDTKNIIGGLFRLSIQYISQLLTVLSQISKKIAILTSRCRCVLKTKVKVNKYVLMLRTPVLLV